MTDAKADEARSGEAEVPEEGKAAHPVIRAAEEKLAAVEAGEYMDVDRHQAIRAKHLGDGAFTPEQLAARKGDKNG
jgi:hypothetical protein